MPFHNPSDATIKSLLTPPKLIAMVGASDKPSRASNRVMAFLLAKGFDVVPVNPQLAGAGIHGKTVAKDLASVGRPIDMVDIFRASEHVAPIVAEAIALHAKCVWMQLGVIDEQAALKAQAAGLTVVMDRCPAIEWPRLRLG